MQVISAEMMTPKSQKRFQLSAPLTIIFVPYRFRTHSESETTVSVSETAVSDSETAVSDSDAAVSDSDAAVSDSETAVSESVFVPSYP